MWAPAGLHCQQCPTLPHALTGQGTHGPQNKEAYSHGSLDSHVGHVSLCPPLKGSLCWDQQGGHSRHDQSCRQITPISDFPP